MSESLVPPEPLATTIGAGDFLEVGREFLGHFRNLCGLEPGERVLDVGCGVGRMAVALTGYLGPEGRYEGFDVMPPAIAWCKEQIEPPFPNFHFQLADVHNSKYNPAGSVQASEYSFPYPDESFDFAFATSVFTHIWPDAAERYLGEIARVLRKGGRSLVTFYLLDVEAERLVAEGKGRVRFDTDHGTHIATSRELPDGRVALRMAYREDFVRTLYARCGLRIAEPVHRGSWSGRSRYASFQDLVVSAR